MIRIFISSSLSALFIPIPVAVALITVSRLLTSGEFSLGFLVFGFIFGFAGSLKILLPFSFVFGALTCVAELVVRVAFAGSDKGQIPPRIVSVVLVFFLSIVGGVVTVLLIDQANGGSYHMQDNWIIIVSQFVTALILTLIFDIARRPVTVPAAVLQEEQWCRAKGDRPL